MTAQKVAELLIKERRPFNLEGIKDVLQKRNLEIEGSVDAFAQAVFEEGLRWTMRAIEAFWEVLGNGFSYEVSTQIERGLRNGERMLAWYNRELGGRVRIGLKNKVTATFYPSRPLPLHKFFLDVAVGDVRFSCNTWDVYGNLSNYYDFNVANDQVFFRDSSVRDVLKGVASLHPFLSFLGIEGVEAALRKLKELEEGESRIEGRYVLAKNGAHWLLKGGAILGNPTLDKAILAGGPVAFTFPGGDISFSARFPSEKEVTLKQLSIRWAGEAIYFDSVDLFSGHIFANNPIVDAIKAGLRQEFERLEYDEGSPLYKASPRMLAFLRAFMEHEDPLHALADREFRPYVVAEFFADF